MKLSNSFTINRPLDEVYEAFLQVERIAACMPGAQLLGQPEPGTYEGEVKVKVGPLAMTYTGQLVVLDADAEARRLTMRAKGREKRGAGNADAYVVAVLSESASGTLVAIDTDLDIRGRVAQFGRGVVGDVADGIMQAFARNVEELLSTGGGSQPPAAVEVASAASAPSASGSAATAAPRPAVSPRPAVAAEAAGSELDAWSLVVRPLLRRHRAAIATVAFAGLAAWLGARAGARGRNCHHD